MSNIYQSLAAVMQDVLAVKKGERNQAQGFNFRGIDAVVNAVGPALRKHGVICTPHVESYEYQERTVGKNASQVGHVVVQVTYTFHALDGSSVSASVVGEAMDSGDKAVAKAMSVAYRIALLQALCLPTDEPDPDSVSYERTEKATTVKAAKPVKTDLQALADTISACEDTETLKQIWRENESSLELKVGKMSIRSMILAKAELLKEVK